MREVPTHLKVFLLLLLPLLTRTHLGSPSRRQNFDESQLCLLYNIWSRGESEGGNFEVMLKLCSLRRVYAQWAMLSSIALRQMLSEPTFID